MYRILLTDDEYLIADGLFEYIHSRRGEVFDVVKAYSAEEGLSVMERMRVDIVVTDIEMPVVNGLSFHETICRKWPRAKIIFLTAHSNFDYVYYASRFPNTRFLLKSDGFAALLSLLDETARQISGELFSRGFLSAEAPGNGGIIPAQMSVMRGLLTAPPDVYKRQTRAYEEKLGYKLDFKIVAVPDQYSQKIALAMSSNDLPDIWISDKKNFYLALEGDYLYDLTDLYEEKLSDLSKKYVEEYELPFKAATVDGRLMAMPELNEMCIRDSYITMISVGTKKTNNSR